MLVNPIPGYWTARGLRGQIYNEAAFRHFLTVDRLRARRSRRDVFLVLVGLRGQDGRPAMLSTGLAAAIFRGLVDAVREVDFVGWFREGRMPAALLVQGADAPEAQVIAGRAAARLGSEVAKRLPSALMDRVRVRVVRLGSHSEGWMHV